MPGTERWIVLCGSMSMHARMLEEKQYLEEAGVTVIFAPSRGPCYARSRGGGILGGEAEGRTSALLPQGDGPEDVRCPGG